MGMTKQAIADAVHEVAREPLNTLIAQVMADPLCGGLDADFAGVALLFEAIAALSTWTYRHPGVFPELESILKPYQTGIAVNG